MSEVLKSKRFVIRKSLIGKNQVIEVTFKNGKTAKYNHDKVYAILKDKLEAMPCFQKYKWVIVVRFHSILLNNKLCKLLIK